MYWKVKNIEKEKVKSIEKEKVLRMWKQNQLKMDLIEENRDIFAKILNLVIQVQKCIS